MLRRALTRTYLGLSCLPFTEGLAQSSLKRITSRAERRTSPKEEWLTHAEGALVSDLQSSGWPPSCTQADQGKGQDVAWCMLAGNVAMPNWLQATAVLTDAVFDLASVSFSPANSRIHARLPLSGPPRSELNIVPLRPLLPISPWMCFGEGVHAHFQDA